MMEVCPKIKVTHRSTARALIKPEAAVLYSLNQIELLFPVICNTQHPDWQEKSAR